MECTGLALGMEKWKINKKAVLNKVIVNIS